MLHDEGQIPEDLPFVTDNPRLSGENPYQSKQRGFALGCSALVLLPVSSGKWARLIPASGRIHLAWVSANRKLYPSMCGPALPLSSQAVLLAARKVSSQPPRYGRRYASL